MLPILLLLPLAFGVFIHWGFYNFALGVPLFLLFASYWSKAKERRNAATFLITALFLAGLYLTHITAVVAACLLLAADGIARAIRTLERSGPRFAARQLLIDGAWAAAAALPVLLLIASFLFAYRNIPGETAGTEGGIVAALRRIKSGDLMWPAFFGLVVLLSLLNLKTGSALLSERLAPFSWIAVVMAIASRQPAPALVRTLCLAAVAGLIGQTAIRTVAYKSWSPTLESELAAGRDNPGATFANIDLIALRSSALFAWRVRPTLHAAQTAAVAARGAGLSSPLPSTRYFGYFPLQYAESRDFMRATPDWDSAPDAASVTKFRNANQGAPRVLIVSSSDTDGSVLARQLGYSSCKTSEGGARALAVCKVATQVSAAHE
jgi:hypothetical protein